MAQYPMQDPATSASLTNLVQPPPNAAALGKYADFPVSYFTGVPDISIPIYELKDGDADLPISLTYHASGIRVGELASWVGLGWAINAGGVILRTVKGTADEGSYSGQGDYGNPAPLGYYLDSGLTKFPKLPYTDANGLPVSYNSGSGLPLTHYAALGLGTGVVDGEPDIFTFNFNGHTGKFLFDENRTPRLLKDDNLKITVNFNGTDFVSWTITDENGVKYLFGQNQTGNNYERVLQQYPTPEFPGKGPITSWYLNQIIYPNNRDTINFTYTNENYYYADLSPESESLSFEALSATSPSPYSPSDMLNNTLNVATSRSNPPLPTVSSNNGVRLTGISSKNISIIFEADNLRKDFENMGRELDKIKIYSKLTGQCIDQFSLNYGYFNSPFTSAFAGNSFPFSQYLSDSLRLKLLSIDEFSGDSSIVKPPYLFTYQDSFYLPRRLSFDQDHWGFSNNSSTPYNRYLTPGGIWLSTLGSTTAAGANREPSWPQMSAGTLTGIKDPLGAVTTFQYEANQASGYLPTGNSMIGGLRIKQITVKDSLTNSVSVRNFQYGPGVLYQIPSYVITYMNEFYLTETTGGTTGFLGSGHASLGRTPGMLKQSQSIVPMQDLDGAHIGYNTVTELFGTNGENGKKIYSYDQGFVNADENSSKINPLEFIGSDYFSNPYPQFGLTGTTAWISLGNGLFNEIVPASLNQNLEPGYNNNSFYPSAPEQIDLTRGNLLQVQTFDASGNLLQNINNKFDTTFHGGYWIRGVKGFENPAPALANNIDDGLTFYILHTGISHLTYTATTNYEGGNPVTDTIKYSYESPYHTLPTKITNLRSNGDSIIQKTYYSFDYSPTATSDGIFGVMQQMNLLSPVAKEVWENNTMTGSQVTAFSDFNTNATLGHVVKPSKIYMLATNTPLTTSQAGETSAYSGLRYALLPNNYYTERVDLRFDSVGNAAQENKVKDKVTSYQWGYGGIYPVAKVDNSINTFSTGDSSLLQYKSFQLAASSGQGSTQNYSFSIYPTGTLSLSIGYGGNPGTNPTYNVGYVIYGGSSGNITGTFCKGTGCPVQYTATSVNYPNLAAGNYSISVTPYSNVNTSNLPLNLSSSYASLEPVSSGIKEFFYDGFEENNNSNVINGAAHTGKKYWNGSTYTTSYTLPDSKAYTIQWWRLSGGVWIFNQQAYTGPTTLTGPVDDIRIFPSDALMSTYTYDPGIGMTSQTDPSGHSTNYFYDSLRRLSYIKDQDGNILKKICYNYNGQTTSCILNIFTNVALSRTYTRNNCGAGYTGSNVTYTVPAGKYSASTQAAADQLAATDTATNGQNYANTNGTCTSTGNFSITTPNSSGLSGFQAVFTNTSTLIQTTFSIPAAGGTLGTLPGGTYDITLSKPGNNLSFVYTVCGNVIAQVSATFNNIVIGSACNSLDVDTF